MRIRSTFAATLFLAAVLAQGAWAQEAGKFGAPKDFTLAIGDSLAFGYQESKVFRNPFDLAQFHTGFAFVFTKRVAGTAPGTGAQVLNLGCPGETTGSFFIACDYQERGFPLHLGYRGAQIDAAEALLAGHRGRVSPILISLGANDVLGLLALCPGPRPGTLDPDCIAANLPRTLGTVALNLDQVLTRLRALAPDAEIVMLQLYNPLEFGIPGSNVLAFSLNEVIGKVAAAHRARVANAFPAINSGLANVCAYTLICEPPLDGTPDIHLSDAGNALVADLLFKAADYSRFEH